MLLRILFLSSFTVSTLADHCTNLARLLGPGIESYTSGRTCHGLFWVVAGGSLICQHSSLTSSWCPDRYAVTQSEAESILSGSFLPTPSLASEEEARSALSLYTTASPTVSTTESVSSSAAVDDAIAPTPSRRQRRVYPVPRSAARPQPERVPMTPTPRARPVVTDNGDVCRILHPESYETSSGLCHGLYWRTISHTEFCYHSAATADECPVLVGHEVSLGQAAEFVHQLNRETTTRTPRTHAAGISIADLLPALENAPHGFAPDDGDVVIDHDPRINTNIRPLVEQ